MKTFKNLFLLFFLLSISAGYAQPSTGAPTPTKLPADVASVYSDTYTSPFLGVAAGGTAFTAGTETRFYNTANGGMAFQASGAAASMTFLHLDIYTTSANAANVFVIVNSQTGQKATPNGTWTSLDIPASELGGFTSVGQVRILPYAGSATFYIDNVYFWKPASGGNPAPTYGAFSIPTKVVGAADFAIPAPTTNSTGAITYTSSNTGVATIVSGSSLHVVGAGSSTITLNQAADATHAAGTTSATFTVTPASTTPTAGPATPPARNTWDVFSQYGAAYTNQTGVTFYDFGGSTIVGDVTLGDGQVVKKYTNHLYSGISTNGALTLNVSAMTKMHIDVWSPDFVSFKIKLEAANGGNRELEVPATKVQGAWNSYDLDLSTYSSAGGPDMTQLRYIVPVTNDGAGRTLYITNVYFYRPATTQPPTLGSFTVPAKNVGDADFTLTPPSSNSAGAWSYSSSNTAVATISGSTLHIVGGGSSTITATQAANGAYGAGTATATFVASYPAPGASPVPPARNAGDVVSMFTGTPTVYANGTTAVRADWSNGATTMTTVPNGANTALRVDNMGYLGLVTNGANFSVVGMTKLHVDVYLNTSLPSLFVFLLAPGDNIYTANNLSAGWNSLDIDLSNYGGANLANIYGLKFESNSSPSAFQMYLDNVYFYRPAGIVPTLSNFSIPSKVVGDADFAITPPSSDSPGAFTYLSSNTSVATIIGGNIHVVGAGTSTITANQAAATGYEAGSITTTFTVSPPPLTTPAPTPPARNPWDVISVYSNAYTATGTPSWSADAAVTDELLSGNDTKKISNFLVENVEFGAQDLTAMTMMHLDVYSDDCTGMNLWLLNNGDRNAQRTITLNQWNSFDIPLSTYTALGLNLNGVHLLKFESLNGSGKTIYVDNVYFYRPATTQPPTLTNFTIPTKAYNDADFVITPPTSNSTGAFSYTSSNTNVATIVNGNMIHIVGGGTSTITATQAADGGSYGTASITAQLTVTFPLPGASPVPPARTPDRVFSMFTGNPPVYANSITAASAPWSAATMTEVPNGTNTALRLDNFGFLGLTDVAETHFDISGMSHLHIDIYLNEPLSTNPGLSRVNVFLLANGDYLFPVSNLTAGWNSISIPLTNFAPADLTTAWGLKLESINPATQIYIDNVYFSNECYTYYADADLDGFGNPDVTQTVCDGSGIPAGYVANNSDCNDGQFQYADVDGDGFGSNVKVACGVTNNTDCNDNQLQYADLDGDGFGGGTLVACGVSNHDDCDDGTIRYADSDNDGFGSLVKVACGGVTNSSDCNDNQVRYADADNDGYGSLVKVACGGVTNSTDCDDTKNTVHPGATEIGYNLIDDDCDGLIDEGFPPKSTTITGVQCSTTLPTIDTQLYADLVAGAQGYQWKITTLSGPNTGQVQILNTALRVMRLTQLATYAYATTYKIEVAVYFAGFLQPYTASNCTIATPALTTSLVSCGQTLSAMSDVIYANNVVAATGYRFRITEGANTTVLDRNVREFRMNLITAFPVKFNTVYNVEVAVKNTDGSYLPYGPVCTVTTPIFPTTSIQDSQCDAYAPPTVATSIYATSYPGAIAYAFNLSGNNFGTNGVEVIRNTRTFKLSDFTGLIPGATYNVRVRLIFNNNDPAGNYGKTCSVTVPGAARMAQLAFNATAYPNPFSDGFNINVTTSSHDKLIVKIYDMTGRLLENRSVTASEIESLTIGENLPSGVYNAIVSQGEEVKTLRVIKR